MYIDCILSLNSPTPSESSCQVSHGLKKKSQYDTGYVTWSEGHSPLKHKLLHCSWIPTRRICGIISMEVLWTRVSKWALWQRITSHTHGSVLVTSMLSLHMTHVYLGNLFLK